MKVAHDFESEGKLLHAAQIYNQILRENPDFIEVYYNISNLYERMGNIKPALNILKSYLEDNPENKDIRLFLGQYLLRNSKWEDAIDILGLIQPEDEPIVAFFIGYSHFMLGEYEPAKISLDNFINIEDKTELVQEANIYLAKICLKLSDFENALLYAKKAEVLYSNFWELNQIYAETYYNLGMYAHAVGPIEKAIKLNPTESTPYETAGKIYLKLSDYNKAEKYFLKFIETIEDASSEIYTKLAEACLNGEKPKDALAYFDIAIKLDPENKTALAGKNKAASILNNNMVSDG